LLQACCEYNPVQISLSVDEHLIQPSTKTPATNPLPPSAFISSINRLVYATYIAYGTDFAFSIAQTGLWG